MSYTKTKPVFQDIETIKPGEHCYNVYCKVVKATHSTVPRHNGELLKICEGVVADASSSANFRFEGETADSIKEGQVIAIRNGRSEVVQEHIRLEVDKFGRVTVEDDAKVGKVNTTDSISTHAYERKPRGDDEREDRREHRREHHREDRRGGRDDRREHRDRGDYKERRSNF